MVAFIFKCHLVLVPFHLDFFKQVGIIILKIIQIQQRIHVCDNDRTRHEKATSAFFSHLEGNARAERYQQELISHILLGIAVAVILFIIFN